MSTLQDTDTRTRAQPLLSGFMTLMLAIGAGLSVASIYYAQPILPQMGHDLNLTLDGMGMVPTLTQMGYALGILLLLPLGDRYDRRTVIAIKSVTLTAMLWLCSQVNGSLALWLSSLLLGMAATLAQDIVPVAAILAPNGKQGKTVGTVMTGLLVGILLSRTISGVVGEYIGWRAMYQLAALSIGVIGLVLWRILPPFAQHSTLSYPGLLRSMLQLWRRYPALRRAALAQGLLSVGFSAFWSTLAMMLEQHYQLGSAIAGAFGLAGAAGAMAAPLSGALSDRYGAERVTQLGAALSIVAFASLFLLPALPLHAQLALIALSAVGFDLGLQSALVAHQTLVYSLNAEARGRLNALLFTGVFIGMALGSALGAKALAMADWSGVVVLATSASIACLVVRMKK